MVAIKDFEMPKRCANCKLCVDDKTNDYGSYGKCLLQNRKEVDTLLWEIDEDCPLVEINCDMQWLKDQNVVKGVNRCRGIF